MIIHFIIKIFNHISIKKSKFGNVIYIFNLSIIFSIDIQSTYLHIHTYIHMYVGRYFGVEIS